MLIIAIIYLIIAVGNYTLSMNYWRNEFPELSITVDDYIISIMVAVAGPIGLIIMNKDTFKHLNKVSLYILKKDK